MINPSQQSKPNPERTTKEVMSSAGQVVFALNQGYVPEREPEEGFDATIRASNLSTAELVNLIGVQHSALRVTTKYLVFDFEASYREQDKLNKMVCEKFSLNRADLNNPALAPARAAFAKAKVGKPKSDGPDQAVEFRKLLEGNFTELRTTLDLFLSRPNASVVMDWAKGLENCRLAGLDEVLKYMATFLPEILDRLELIKATNEELGFIVNYK